MDETDGLQDLDFSDGGDIQSLADNNSPNITGTTNYMTDTGTTGSVGSVVNSSANPVTSNSGPVDASGGNGSLPNALQNIATQGLNDAIVSANEFGIGSLTDLLRVGASGTTTAAAAPSAPTTQASTGVSPLVWLALGAVVIYLIAK